MAQKGILVKFRSNALDGAGEESEIQLHSFSTTTSGFISGFQTNLNEIKKKQVKLVGVKSGRAIKAKKKT